MSIYEDNITCNRTIDKVIQARAAEIRRTYPHADIVSYLRDEEFKEFDIQRALRNEN